MAKTMDLPGPRLQLRRKLAEGLVAELVELDHHFPVRVLIGPLALELSRIVARSVNLGALGDETRDAGREFIRDEKALAKRCPESGT